MESVAKEVNESVRRRENWEKLVEIQKSFVGNINLLARTDRMFVRDGDLFKICRKKPKLFHFILFSDALVYGEEIPGTGKYVFHREVQFQPDCLVLYRS